MLIFITTYRSLYTHPTYTRNSSNHQLAIDRFGKKIIAYIARQKDNKVQVVRDLYWSQFHWKKGVLYFKGHLIYTRRSIRIDPQGPTDWIDDCGGSKKGATAAITAVADRTDKTLKPAVLEWRLSSIRRRGIPLESTVSILYIHRINPDPQGTDSVLLAASIQVANRPHKTDLFQWKIPLEILDRCSGISSRRIHSTGCFYIATEALQGSPQVY